MSEQSRREAVIFNASRLVPNWLRYSEQLLSFIHKFKMLIVLIASHLRAANFIFRLIFFFIYLYNWLSLTRMQFPPDRNKNIYSLIEQLSVKPSIAIVQNYLIK